MPNETMIKLGQLSKKSPQQVETTYNTLMDQLKKSNSLYKAYDNEQNPNNKSKKYGEFMAFFMKELKKKLGIAPTLEVESIIRESSDLELEYIKLANLEDKEIFAIEAGMINMLKIIRAEMKPIKARINELEGSEIYPIDESVIRESSLNIKGYKRGKRSADVRWEKGKGYVVSFLDDGQESYQSYSDEISATRAAKRFISKEELEEDGEGAVAGITTGNMGSPTMATGEKAPFGSSAIYADRASMTSRGGQVGMPKPLKKKKKKIRESIEYIDRIIGE